MDWVMAAEAAGGEGGGSGFWQLALVLAGIGFLGFFARWRKSRTPQLPSAREMRERDEDPNRYRDTADKAIVELLETSRTLNAQVDNKIRVLNRLVKEAEGLCGRLERLLADGRLAEEAGTPPAPAPTPPAGEPEAEEPAPAKAARVFLSELHERIFRLREDGRGVAEIAKATNLSTTEVEFALNAMGDD